MSWRRAIMAVGLLGALALVASAQENLTEDQAARLKQQADKFYEAEKYDKALPLYERLVKAAPGLWGAESAEHASALEDLAETYRAMEQYAKAAPLYLNTLKICEKLRGPDHADVAHVLNKLGLLYHALGQDTKAEPLYQRSLKIREASLGAEHTGVADSLYNLATLYCDAAQYAKAEPLYQRSLKIYEKVHGADHTEVADTLNRLALLYQALGQYAKAESLFQRSLKIWEARRGPEQTDAADVLNNLASLYQQMGQYAKADPLFQRCLKIRETKRGPDHPEVAQTLNNIAMLDSAIGQYNQAELLYLRSLKIRESTFGPQHTEVADSLNNLALLYQVMGRYAKAEQLFHRSSRIRDAQLGPEHPDVAASLHNLAGLYQETGQYAKAEPLHLRSLKMLESKLGREHPDVALALNNLGLLYHGMGQYAKAEPLYQRSLKIREAKLGAEHPDVAQTLANLAALYQEAEEYAKAEPLYERALKIVEAKFGPQNADVAAGLGDLASLYQAMGQHAKAEPLYQRGLKILEAKLGPEHPDVAAGLDGLASLYRATGQYTKAEPLMTRALEIFQARFDRHHPAIIHTQQELTKLYALSDRRGEAFRLFDRALRSARIIGTEVLPILSESGQLAFLAESEHVGLALGLSLALGKPSEENRHRSASWLLNGKAMSEQSLAERTLLARGSENARAGELLAEWTAVRQELAKAALARIEPGKAEQLRKRQEELQAKEVELSLKLHVTDERRRRDDPWVELDDVRAKLPAGAVYVDFARFPVSDFQRASVQDLPERYVAWITPKSGDVHIVDLGLSKEIDAAIQEAGQAIERSPKTVAEMGEAAAEKKLRASLAALAKRILEPLRSHLDAAEHWVLCPDASLWLVPWAALPLDDSTYVIEKHTIQYVVTGRDLVLHPLRLDLKNTQPMILADPDFDLDPAELANQSADALRALSVAPVVSLAGQRARGKIGDWNVSFAFAEEGRMTIRDEDDGGKVVGEGTWSLRGAKLTMRTSYARYTGFVKGDIAAGERLVDGKTDHWELRLPDDAVAAQRMAAELRSAGSFHQALTHVARLPGTAAEAEAVTPSVKTYTGAEPGVYTGKRALEGVVKAARSPRILLLSTHGFFLPDQEVKHSARAGGGLADEASAKVALTRDGQPLENPLLRCGLLLAGCNQRHKSAIASDQDDGVLTGLEIVGTDLRGTELVVLSACETGLGDIRNGEGVAGLRQAFQLAGAQSVVATLWQIPDRDSALLMSDFFDQLAKGRSKTEALRAAQLARIKARRERNGAAHPFFWAAFTLTGQDVRPK